MKKKQKILFLLLCFFAFLKAEAQKDSLNILKTLNQVYVGVLGDDFLSSIFSLNYSRKFRKNGFILFGGIGTPKRIKENALHNSSFGDFALEKGSDGGIYISSTLGVFYLNNKTIADQTYWQQVGLNLPHCLANSIEINYKINRIRVATNGRGLWEHALVCPSDFNLNETITYSSDEFIEAENDITSTATVNAGRTVTYRAGNEIILSDGFVAVAGSDFDAFIHPCDYGVSNSFRTVSSSEGLTGQENEESTENEVFSIYPNPNNGDFKIEFLEPNSISGEVFVSIIDFTGRKVFSEKKSVSELEENSFVNANLVPGIYLLRMESVSVKESKKFIIVN